MFVTVLAAAALAADPVVEIESDHVVRGRLVVQAPADVVESLIDDPVKLATIDDESGVEVTVREQSGACKTLHTAIAHPIASADYTSRACRTESGWQHQLVESRAIKHYEASWTVAETDSGTEVTYAVKTQTSLPVPQFVVDRQSRSAVTRLLGKLRDHFERRRTRLRP